MSRDDERPGDERPGDEPQRRAQSARARAERAGRRAQELRTRLEQLKAAHPVTDDDVARARQAAELSADAAAQELRHARDAHQDAAQTHREAASLADSVGDTGVARGHREAAAEDDDRAERGDEETPEHDPPGA